MLIIDEHNFKAFVFSHFVVESRAFLLSYSDDHHTESKQKDIFHILYPLFIFI